MPLHILRPSFPALPPIQPLPQLQQIIHTECRTTCGNASEGVDRKQIGDIDQQGLKPSVGAVVKNTILSPTEVSTDQLILIPHQRMKRMGNAESTDRFTCTTCS